MASKPSALPPGTGSRRYRRECGGTSTNLVDFGGCGSGSGSVRSHWGMGMWGWLGMYATVEVEIRGLVGIEVHGLRLSGIVRLG
jgi:hypothetical protein